MRGTLTEHRINGKECTVYLPPSYSVQTGLYPVCTYWTGFFVLEQMDKLESQFANGTLPELILPASNRLTGSMSTHRGRAFLSPAFHDFGGKGRLFLEELTDAIIPTVEDMHHISAHPETRVPIGASLGGLFSVYAMLQKPEIFGRIGCISGSFWYEKSADYVRSKTP